MRSSARPGAAYAPVLAASLRWRLPLLGGALAFVVFCGWLATRLGSEFIPNLNEGDLAVQALRIPGTSLTQSIEMQFQLERALADMPEVKTYFSRVGTAEVATDPMPPNISDGYVMLTDHESWPDPDKSRDDLVAEIEERLEAQPGNAFEISQPIELRFNELISGVRSDLGIKVYGDDLDQLLRTGNAIAAVLSRVPGAEGVKVEQVAGLPVLSVEPDRAAMYRYGLNVADLQHVLAAATGGEEAGQIFEGDRRFALVVQTAGTRAWRCQCAGTPAHPVEAGRVRPAGRGRQPGSGARSEPDQPRERQAPAGRHFQCQGTRPRRIRGGGSR